MADLDLYTTRNLVACIQGIDPASSFLRDRYFTAGPLSLFKSEKVLVEYREGSRRLAPFVYKRKDGVIMDREGSSMREYTPPTIAPKRAITLDDISKRGFGEALFGDDITPAQRSMALAAMDLNEMDNEITRREEWMAAQVMLDNGCVMQEYGDDADLSVENEIRFYSGDTNPAAISAVTTKWDATGADIIGDMAKMIELLVRNGLPASDFVCAPDVADAIVNNEKIQKLLDNRRYDLGQVAPRLQTDSASVMCQLNVRGRVINVISYDEVYEGADGTLTSYIPSGCGIMTAPGAGRRYYGAVTQLEQDDKQWHTYTGARVPKYEADTKDEVRTLKLTSRPLLAPYNKDCFISAKGLLTA